MKCLKTEQTEWIIQTDIRLFTLTTFEYFRLAAILSAFNTDWGARAGDKGENCFNIIMHLKN